MCALLVLFTCFVIKRLLCIRAFLSGFFSAKLKLSLKFTHTHTHITCKSPKSLSLYLDIIIIHTLIIIYIMHPTILSVWSVYLHLFYLESNIGGNERDLLTSCRGRSSFHLLGFIFAFIAD